MEFAVIQTGGKQYTVSKGDSISIEKILGDHKEGDKIVFDHVLLVDDGKNTTIGTPYILNASVKVRPILPIASSKPKKEFRASAIPLSASFSADIFNLISRSDIFTFS